MGELVAEKGKRWDIVKLKEKLEYRFLTADGTAVVFLATLEEGASPRFEEATILACILAIPCDLNLPCGVLG